MSTFPAPGFAPPAQTYAQPGYAGTPGMASPTGPIGAAGTGFTFNPFDPNNLAKGGGSFLFRDTTGMVERFRMILYDYNGKIPKPFWAFYASIVGFDGSVHDEYWGLGASSTDWLVAVNEDTAKGPNGETLYTSFRPITNVERLQRGLQALPSDADCAAKAKVQENSKAGMLLKSLANNKFPMEQLFIGGKPTLNALDGSIFFWITEPILFDGKKQTRTRTDKQGKTHEEDKTALVVGIGPDGQAIKKFGWDTATPGYQRDPVKVAAQLAARQAAQAGQSGMAAPPPATYNPGQPVNGGAGYSAPPSYAPPSVPSAPPAPSNQPSVPAPTVTDAQHTQFAEMIMRYVSAPTTPDPVTNKIALSAVMTQLSVGAFGRPGMPQDITGLLAWMNNPAVYGDRLEIVKKLGDQGVQMRARGAVLA